MNIKLFFFHVHDYPSELYIMLSSKMICVMKEESRNKYRKHEFQNCDLVVLYIIHQRTPLHPLKTTITHFQMRLDSYLLFASIFSKYWPMSACKETCISKEFLFILYFLHFTRNMCLLNHEINQTQ